MVTLSDDSAVRIWRFARPLVGAPGEGSDMEVGKCKRLQREIGMFSFINTYTESKSVQYNVANGYGVQIRVGIRFRVRNNIQPVMAYLHCRIRTRIQTQWLHCTMYKFSHCTAVQASRIRKPGGPEMKSSGHGLIAHC